LDILGHVDPYALRMLQDMTGIDLFDIPMNDEKVLSIFTSTEAIGVTEEQILNENASGGIPEFGTSVVKRILHDAKPTKFSELVQVSGISHGTDVWTGNAQDLITSGRCTLMEAIGCRDDIMTYLYQNGLDHTAAFKIMESVRKGRGLTDDMQADMRKHKIPEWYIESCLKIQYMFPKAHAVAYVSMGLRIAWFKIYKPLYYYASFFSLRCDAYELETMVKGYDAIKARYLEIKEKIKERIELSTKEKNGLDDCLMIALEMTARGYHFENVSLEKSDVKKWIVDEENNALIPAFTVIDGFGESAAQSVVEARKDKPFISKQDLISRTSVGSSLVKVFEDMHMLDDIQDEDQLSFDLF